MQGGATHPHGEDATKHAIISSIYHTKAVTKIDEKYRISKRTHDTTPASHFQIQQQTHLGVNSTKNKNQNKNLLSNAGDPQARYPSYIVDDKHATTDASSARSAMGDERGR
jgi:hypothetical protein